MRLKNKGAKKRRGRRRQKYQAPVPEHPQTNHDVAEESIHANHVEAFNASLRRRNAAFRRKTNTYAKSRKHLQRTLDVYVASQSDWGALMPAISISSLILRT